MEPRLRGIEHVEFWRVDEHRRRRGLREAPVYSLDRARGVLTAAKAVDAESAIEEIRSDVGVEDEPPETPESA
jgi:hypothetical protein